MATNSISSNGIRMAGLASGLDTESLVKQMASYSKIKLNTQKQKLQLLQWKQEDYRSVISKISAFKDTYFNLLKADTNLGSNKVFASRSATSTSELVKATATASANKASYNITEVQQIASAAKVSSGNLAVNGIKLDYSNATEGTDYTLKLKLDGLEKSVTFTGGADSAETQQNFLDAVNGAFSATGAEFSMNGGRLVANTASNPNLIHSFSISESATPSSGVASELKAIGLDQAKTSTASSNVALSTLAFSTELQGNSFSFEINGVKFAFDKTATLSQVMNKINNSEAKVTMSYSSISGSFSLQSKDSGAGSSISIKQTSGNLLTSMFGESNIAASTSISTQSFRTVGVQGNASSFKEEKSTADLESIVNKQVKITVNGEEKTIGLWGYNASGDKNDYTKAATVVTQLNYELSKQFGSAAPKFSFDTTTNKFSLVGADASDEITIEAIEDTSGGSDRLLSSLGFNDTNNTNIVDTTASIVGGLADGLSYDIKFNDGSAVSITNQTTLESLVDESNGNITYENGRLLFKGLDYAGSDDEVKPYLASIFGENYSFPGVPPFPDPNSETAATFAGKNAIVTINGATISNSSNSITIDGTTMDISKLSVGATDITITTTNDSSKAVDAIKQFVTDYNALISDLYKQIRTEYDNNYKPLTDEQTEEMSEKEIEKWDETAKTGLLYQDQTINKFLTQLRQAVSGTTVDRVGLYDMGIKVSTNYLDFGKLELDEAALQKAIDEDPEKIQKFFTDPDNGFAARVTNVINSTVSTSGNSKGTLTLLAGVPNTTTATENKMSKEIKTYKELIESLQDKYEDEMNRYWKQFTALEKVMKSYESQSSWLTSQFSV